MSYIKGADFAPKNMTSDVLPSPYVAIKSTELATFEAYKAFDGILTNGGHYWLTALNQPVGYIGIDIGSGNTKKLYSYKVYVHSNAGGEPNRTPKNWTFEGSNTGAWGGEQTTLDTQTNQTGWASGEGREFTLSSPSAAYRYFRLNISANNGDTQYSQCSKLYLYEAVDVDDYTKGADFAPHNMTTNSLPTPYVASASSEFGAGSAAYKAFDGGLGASQNWISNATSSGWLKIDVGSVNANKLYSYKVYSNNAGDTQNRSPKTWTFEGSNTGSFSGEQVVLDTQNDQSAWVAGEGREFPLDQSNMGTAYRYFRSNISANNGDTYLEVGELYLYKAEGGPVGGGSLITFQW